MCVSRKLKKNKCPFNSFFSRRIWVRHLCKNVLNWNEARNDGVLDWHWLSRDICKQSAPCSREITMPTPHHSIFTGRMLFLVCYQLCRVNLNRKLCWWGAAVNQCRANLQHILATQISWTSTGNFIVNNTQLFLKHCQRPAKVKSRVRSKLKVQNSSTFQGLSRTQIAFFKHKNYRQKAISWTRTFKI